MKKTYIAKQKKISRTFDTTVSQRKQTQYPLQLMRVIQMKPGEEIAQILSLIKKTDITDITDITNKLTTKTENAHNLEKDNFVSNQIEYQKYLVELGLDVNQIMNFHKSAGYEFEFASFKTSKEVKDDDEEHLPSHIELAKSDILNSHLFNLPFFLETDSNNSLELVTPPFLFLSSYIPLNILTKTFDKYAEKTKDINSLIPKKGYGEPFSLDNLITYFDGKYFGNNWTKTTPENVLAIKNEKHTSGPYGQANVSMTANEIAALLIKLSTKRESYKSLPLCADKSNSGNLFDQINSFLTNKWPEEADAKGAILLYSRFASNLLGIPSLLFRAKTNAKPAQNFATEIKETLGIWIKAHPHEVILDYIKDKTYKKPFLNFIQETEEVILTIITNYLKPFYNCFKIDIEKIIQKDIDTKYGNGYEVIKKAKPIDKVKLLYELKKEKQSWLNCKEDKIEILTSSIISESTKKVEIEFKNFVNLIFKSDIPIIYSKPAPFKEDFETGIGVRKDTFIPPVDTKKGTNYVGEVRGRGELQDFENSE